MKNWVGFKARLPQGRIILAGLLVAVLAGCGGSSGSSKTKVANSFIDASLVLGHSDYTAQEPNQSASGSGTGAPTAATVSSPTGAIASDGTLFYIADTFNHRILGYTSLPSSKGQAADFILGQPGESGHDPGTSATQLSYPSKVSISDDGRLVVADTGNNRILIWNSLPTTTDQAADVVVGQTDFASGEPNQGGDPTAQTLSNPTAAMIAKNKLFVVDNNNNRLLIWNLVTSPLPSSGAYDTDATVVWGQPLPTTNVVNCGQGSLDSNSVLGCAADSYPISAYSLNQPQDLWTDGTKLFVADSANNRVLYWSQLPTSYKSSASYVMGQSTFSAGTTGGASQTAMNNPYSVAADGSRLFVADYSNNRVLIFNGFPAGSAEAAYNVLGQNYWNTKTANDDNQNGTADTHPTARTLSGPTGVFAISVSGKENVYVTDSTNNRILLFNPK